MIGIVLGFVLGTKDARIVPCNPLYYTIFDKNNGCQIRENLFVPVIKLFLERNAEAEKERKMEKQKRTSITATKQLVSQPVNEP